MLDNRKAAPLYEALLAYKQREDASFHVPGHKDGQAYSDVDGLLEDHKLLTTMMSIDITEITGSDDLHHPEGVIKEAQGMAAHYFGAEHTFFLVGGSTAGNLGLILSVCTTPGDIVLVQRNVHKSVIHGLMMANANAVFLEPQLDIESGLSTIPSIETVLEALERYPQAKGLLVTHPNYYGMCSSLRPLAEACHSKGVPLLVDEAHGAHFGRHETFPEDALSAGADGVVQSTHKMLTALTMGAMLHVQGNLLNVKLVANRLAMIQSSSPSYPIMASLDVTRSLLQSKGALLFQEGLAAVEAIRQGLQKFTRFNMLQPSKDNINLPYHMQDPYKVVLYDVTGTWSGYVLQEKLEQYGCIPEMSDERYVVLALSQATSQRDVSKLLVALEKLERESNSVDSESSQRQISTWNIMQYSGVPVSSPVQFHMMPLLDEQVEVVTIEESIGRQVAEMIIPYPPGIPILYPGEQITESMMLSLQGLRDAGAKIQGADDPLLTTIRVSKTETNAGGS